MVTLYLAGFVVGLALSLLTVVAGLGHIHLGHVHLHPRLHAKGSGSQLPLWNGFSLSAFLCWFGGVGFLLDRFSILGDLLSFLVAAGAGALGAMLISWLIFRVLLPRERVMTREETQMEGMLARVSDTVRALDGVGEILFSQSGTLRSAAARSEDRIAIERGTEVVVLRYERGIAYVRPIYELTREPISIHS